MLYTWTEIEGKFEKMLDSTVTPTMCAKPVVLYHSPRVNKNGLLDSKNYARCTGLIESLLTE